MSGIEGERSHVERTSQPPKPAEQPKPLQDGGNGSPGLPPTIHERAQPPLASQERQPAPNIWAFLERRERYYRDIKTGIRAREEVFGREGVGLAFLKDAIIQEGTARENLILKLYDAKIKLWGVNPGYIRETNFDSSLSSQEEFQQFRSTVEPMSEAELTEAIRKQEKQNRREWLATKSPEEKRRERSWRYRQKRKEQGGLQIEKQQPMQIYPRPTQE